MRKLKPNKGPSRKGKRLRGQTIETKTDPTELARGREKEQEASAEGKAKGKLRDALDR